MIEKVPVRAMLRGLNRCPQAVACVYGSSMHAEITGRVYFYQMSGGVLVVACVTGLPKPTAEAPSETFGFHIHSGDQCSGTEEDPFADALAHYNPDDVQHPNHAGDLPPLFGNNGYAFQAFFTERFSVREILHRTVIIHARPDDFTTQPSGNSGMKIACGQIEEFKRF